MKVLVTGGAGFIGSHLVDRLMRDGHAVTVVDNLSSGRREFLASHRGAKRFRLVVMDMRRQSALRRALRGRTDIVYHLAANSDVAKGVNNPAVDFEQSLVATFSLLQAMRHHRIPKLVYTSGSGVYGDRGSLPCAEGTGPLLPVSLYGATKLGAEGLISAMAHLHDFRAWIVRPANIVGPRATHGVVFDFVRRLAANPAALRILGDGQQRKSYLHVADVLDALFRVQTSAHGRTQIFNVASDSFLTVDAIARLVLRAMRLTNVRITHTGGRVGWRGDVPVIRLKTHALRSLGWRPRYTARQAVIATVESLLHDARISAHPHAARDH